MRTFLLLLWISWAAIAAMAAEPSRILPANEFLIQLGMRERCFFTLELLREQEQYARFQDRRLDTRLLHQRTNVLDVLQSAFPDFIVRRPEGITNVYHLIAPKLLTYSGYEMGSTIEMRYTGTLGAGRPPSRGKGLATAVGTVCNSIAPRTFGLYDEVWDDTITEVSVNVTNMTVREIFTRAFPLSVYRPLLWRAETTQNDGQINTIVQFYGRRKDGEQTE